MARSITVRIVLLGLALGAVGCGSPGIPAGTYLGKRDYQPRPGEDISVTGTLARVKLTVRPDQTFLLTDGGVPMEGRVKASGDQLILQVETMIGRPISESQTRDFPVSRMDGNVEITFPDEKLILTAQAEAG